MLVLEQQHKTLSSFKKLKYLILQNYPFMIFIYIALIMILNLLLQENNLRCGLFDEIILPIGIPIILFQILYFNLYINNIASKIHILDHQFKDQIDPWKKLNIFNQVVYITNILYLTVGITLLFIISHTQKRFNTDKIIVISIKITYIISIIILILNIIHLIFYFLWRNVPQPIEPLNNQDSSNHNRS